MTTHGRRSTTSPASARTRLLALTGVLVLGAALALPGSPAAASVVAKVDLGTADQFGVLAGSAVTNTGPTVVGSADDTVGLDVGVSPGPVAISGFPPGLVVPPGVLHSEAGGPVAQAQADATTAFNQAAGLPADSVGLTDLGGKVLQPGVYQGNLSLTGTVVLDNSTDPNAVFVFQASSTLITASSSVVRFTDSNHASCNVFWQVGSSATLGSNSTFVGTIDALTAVTAETGATIQGRLIARNAAVTLDDNTITRAPCAVTPPPTTTVTTTSITTTTVKPPTVTTTVKPPTVTTTVKPPTVTTTVKPPTATVTETSTFIPPPLETTTESSLSIITPPTTTPPLETTTRSTLPITTPSGTTTSTNATGTTVTSTTTVYNQILTYTTVYESSTGSTQAQGIDTGSGGSGSSGELASTGVTGVTGLTKSGVLLLVGGVVLLMIAHRRRVQLGHHRLI